MNLLTLPSDLAANGIGIDNAKFMELGQKFDARLNIEKAWPAIWIFNLAFEKQ